MKSERCSSQSVCLAGMSQCLKVGFMLALLENWKRQDEIRMRSIHVELGDNGEIIESFHCLCGFFFFFSGMLFKNGDTNVAPMYVDSLKTDLVFFV